MTGVVSQSGAVESAKKVCGRLHQCYRDFRLYPSGHPTARNTMEALATAFDSHLESMGPLVLMVSEDALSFEGDEVYSHSESRDNLAFLMFRDGIRSIMFSPGLEPGEIEALVDCLAHADQMLDTDHDLSTVLWERDLAHITLQVVDPFLEGDALGDDSFDELRDTVLRRLSELASVDKAEAEAKGATGRDGGSAQPSRSMTRDEQEKIDEASLALTEQEMARGEWLASHPSEPLDEFAVVLLEIFGNPSQLPGGEDAVARALSQVLGRYLDDGSEQGLDLVLGQLGRFESEGRIPPGTVAMVFGGAATAERLGALISSASAVSPEKVENVGRFLSRVRGSVYPALLEALATSSDKVVRKTVLDLLRLEGGTPSQHLWPLMKDERWYVVRNAVQLATASGDPQVVGQLEPLTRHTDARVRREVARSLGALADTRGLSLLVRALQDEDQTVRILAVRSLARAGNRVQFPAVQAQVEARDFETRSPEEVEAYLIAYAALGGERTVEALNKIWKRKMFGTRPLVLRQAAVAALGAVGGAEAKKALSEVMASGEAQLQRVAAQALSEVQAREKGGES